MAKTLWGRVYYQDIYAGLLQQEPNGRCLFTYDPEYLRTKGSTKIAFSFPLRPEPFISEIGLHPFFDNLVAEGWLQNAQARSLGVHPFNRFALLLGFGHDLAGAVSIVDPEPSKQIKSHDTDDVTNAVLQSRASLSGIQRKLLIVKEGDHFRPVSGNHELSTYIAKLASGNLPDILELEYLTTQSIAALLPDDSVVEMEIAPIQLHHTVEHGLIIKRFDRTPSGKRIHFEEFNQLLGHQSGDSKYDGSYEDMGKFIYSNSLICLPTDSLQLYKRILACLLVGNTDAHFKNFAMLHTRGGLRLTPAYDLVASARYKEYRTIALSIGGARNLDIFNSLKPKHLVDMAKAFSLNHELIRTAIDGLHERLPMAISTIAECKVGTAHLRKKLIDIMEKRWKGSFDSIGPLLSKRQSKDVKHKSLPSSD